MRPDLPLGSASIAQVHQPTSLTGEEMVVKVQRPGILKTIAADLAILRNLARLAETHFPEWRLPQPVALVNELARSLEKELDFTCEAAHPERLAWRFRDEPTICPPAVVRDHTTSRLLVMERVDGMKASKVEDLQALGNDPRELGQLAWPRSTRP